MSSTEADIYGVRVSENLSFHRATKINDLLFKKGLITEKTPSLVSHRELVNSKVPLKSRSHCEGFAFRYLTEIFRARIFKGFVKQKMLLNSLRHKSKYKAG